MATSYYEFGAPEGLGLTAEIYPLADSDTVAFSDVAVERLNNLGWYRLTVVDLPSGVYVVRIALTSSDQTISNQLLKHYNTADLVEVGSDYNIAPTVAEISDGVGGVSGPGADIVTLTITNDVAAPIPDADVWITSDLAGTTVIWGTKQTDSNGQIQILLDHGSQYYLWAQKDGWNGIQGQLFTAEAD